MAIRCRRWPIPIPIPIPIPRTFARFYLAQTGITPAHAIDRLRVKKARRLIEGRRQGNKTITQPCGFNAEGVMRRVFVRHLHVSPKGCREWFAAG